MSANIFGNRFYGNREPAWHNLGFVSNENHTAQEALAILGSYWIEKRALTMTLNGEAQETGDFGLVRSAVPDDPKEFNFGYCTKQYNIVQPDTIAQLFDDNVKAPVETLGMLGHGEKIFLTWVLPMIDVNGQEVKLYGFVACGYDGKFGASLNIVSQKVVCENTFRIAISESESEVAKSKGRGRVYTGRHNSANVERDLGIWMEHIQEQALAKVKPLQDTFVKMNSVAVDDTETLADLLFKIYPDPEPIPVDWPMKLRAEKETKIEAVLKKSTNDRILVESLFSGEGTAIDATAWGLFNAVTEYENWGRSTKKSADYSILMGNRAGSMEHAFNVINHWVDTKVK